MSLPTQSTIEPAAKRDADAGTTRIQSVTREYVTPRFLAMLNNRSRGALWRVALDQLGRGEWCELVADRAMDPNLMCRIEEYVSAFHAGWHAAREALVVPQNVRRMAEESAAIINASQFQADSQFPWDSQGVVGVAVAQFRDGIEKRYPAAKAKAAEARPAQE